MDGSIHSNEVRHTHAQPQTLVQGEDHGQVEATGKEGPRPRLQEERHGVNTEPQESHVQQDLPEDHVQHLGPVQVKHDEGTTLNSGDSSRKGYN